MKLCASIRARLAVKPMTTREIREEFELSRQKSHETMRGLWADGWLDRVKQDEEYVYSLAAVKRPSIRMRSSKEQRRAAGERHRRKNGALPLAEHLAARAANKKVRTPKPPKEKKIRKPTVTRTTEARPMYIASGPPPAEKPKAVPAETMEEFLARGGAIERL